MSWPTPYAKRDYRSKCSCCGQWMRYKPTPKTPARRRKRPYANVCEGCLPMSSVPSLAESLYGRGREPQCRRRGCPDAIEQLGNLVGEGDG